MNERNFLIIANGTVNQHIVDKTASYRFDAIVAADGGAEKAVKYGLIPDVIIGDLDSLSTKFIKKHPNIKIIEKPSQELNDLEKSLLYCKEQGALRIIALGITGGRIDHTLNNFSVLAKYCAAFNIKIFNENATIKLVQKELLTFCQPGQTISLIPLGCVKGIKTQGLKYPLNNETLQLGVREGASNTATQKDVHISVENGTLLVFFFD